jgi:hypothetical protein
MVLSTLSFGWGKDLVPSEHTAIFSAAEAAKLIGTVCYRPPASTGYWTPDERDLKDIEDTLEQFLRAQNVKDKKDWNGFRRQVTGIKRGKELYIFVYYFQYEGSNSEPDAWKKMPYQVFDGGSSFFRVLYDVKKRQFIWYESNGEA